MQNVNREDQERLLARLKENEKIAKKFF